MNLKLNIIVGININIIWVAIYVTDLVLHHPNYPQHPTLANLYNNYTCCIHLSGATGHADWSFSPVNYNSQLQGGKKGKSMFNRLHQMYIFVRKFRLISLAKTCLFGV